VRVLLDTCVWGGVKTGLLSASYDVVWAGDWPADPGDEEILAQAHAESRILVTLDKDFGELAIMRGRPHCGIIRMVDISALQQAAVCQRLLERYGPELLLGALITVDANRVRIRARK